MAEVKSPLSEQARKVTGDALQGAVVDLIDLSLQAKQAHWNLIGKRFRSLHLQLDEVVAIARAHTDTCAERAVTIGVNPDGRAKTVSEQTRSPQFGAGYVQDDEVVEVMVDILRGATQRFRERIQDTTESDPVTENLFEEVTHDLEKQLWMFEAQR